MLRSAIPSDTAYGDRIELTDSLRDGVVDNLLVVLTMARGSQRSGARGSMAISNWKTAYTPCPVEDADGCEKPQLKSVPFRVTCDRGKNKVRYKGRGWSFRPAADRCRGSTIRRTAGRQRHIGSRSPARPHQRL